MEDHEDLIKHTKVLRDDIWLVPCRYDGKKHKFLPLIDTSEPFVQSARNWLKAEDDILLDIVRSRGLKNWTKWAKQINAELHEGQDVRTSKQCRARWLNHLNPEIVKSKWTDQEDSLLIEKQIEFGNKWSKIADLLPGRNENAVKNRWKSLQKSSGVKPQKASRKSPKIPLDSIEEYLPQPTWDPSPYPGLSPAFNLRRRGTWSNLATPLNPSTPGQNFSDFFPDYLPKQ